MTDPSPRMDRSTIDVTGKGEHQQLFQGFQKGRGGWISVCSLLNPPGQGGFFEKGFEYS